MKLLREVATPEIVPPVPITVTLGFFALAPATAWAYATLLISVGPVTPETVPLIGGSATAVGAGARLTTETTVAVSAAVRTGTSTAVRRRGVGRSRPGRLDNATSSCGMGVTAMVRVPVFLGVTRSFLVAAFRNAPGRPPMLIDLPGW
ncbi:hypothetical protein [Plantactinospora sp. BB1]|uniref:hypothetical protein n=1 Tax=Plantactinospora sp. BB1 TaxID=2071627 RepID=UPI001F461E4E|nr:hypothetical protein [Plantactinospora sp. BB1]